MSISTLGLLHPGAMGSTVGAAAKAGVPTVLWAAEGRSAASAARAERAGLEDAGTLAELARRSQIIVSVCPPHAAQDVAQHVAATGYRGIFVDANAVAPSRGRRLAGIIEAAGGRFVDGGIIGGPVQRPGATRLYLSGAGAAEVASCFAPSPLEAIVLSGPVGAASALKMAFAVQTKGATALLASILAVAVRESVQEDLLKEWARSYPDLAERAFRQLEVAAPKAWRWVGEMEEIGVTFAEAGLPDGFWHAAAELYRRLESHAEEDFTPPGPVLIQEVLDAG